MNALQRLRRRLDSEFSQAAILKELAAILEDHEEELVALLRGQLEEGRMPGSRGREKKMFPRYQNELYARKKQQMNPKPGYKVPDLKLTGEFHESLGVETSSRGITFFSDHEPGRKLDKILERWGGALALSKERWRAFVDEYLEDALRARMKHKARKTRR